MNRPTVLPTTIPPARSPVERPPLRRGSLLIMLALVCFCLLPAGRAVTPAPDGGYPNGNTAEGDNALLNLTTGTEITRQSVIMRSKTTPPVATTLPTVSVRC